MSDSQIKLRVYKRDPADPLKNTPGETVILWNTNVLPPEIKDKPNLQVQFAGSSGWFAPSLAIPDLRSIKKEALDGPTDGRSILHTGKLNEHSAFTLRISFGPKQEFSTDLEVVPRGAHMGHVRTVRHKKDQRHSLLETGKTVYLNPTLLVAMDTSIEERLAQIMTSAIQRAMGK